MVSIGDRATTTLRTVIDGCRVVLAVDGRVVAVQPQRPPLFGQRWAPWATQRYSQTATYTFYTDGCYVCSLASLACWAGYDTDPLDTGRRLDAAGAFYTGKSAGQVNGERVARAFPRLQWDPATSYLDWRRVPGDTQALASYLARHPVVVQVDWNPASAEVNTHFLLAYAYAPDPDGGPANQLWAMDPWEGQYLDLASDAELVNGKRTGGGYANPAWRLSARTTRVQRVLTGARVFHVDGGV